MKSIYCKYDKKAIQALPRAAFPGRIFVINSESEAEKAVAFLGKQARVGVDTETRPSFKRGHTHQVALLQVSTDDVCFLFRLCEMGVPQCLVELMESEAVKKVGLSLADDWCMLRRRRQMEPHNYVELQKMAPRIGVCDMSLQKLYANLLGGMISKRQQLSNWEADSLSEAQQMYAATDAWACLMLYDEINRLIDTRDYELIRVEEEDMKKEEDEQHKDTPAQG